MNAQSDNSSSPRKAVLILGMHRSGTSLITRVVSLLGADLPAHLMPANEFNETGHWEPAELVPINDEILAHFGMSWDLPFELPDSWRSDAKVADFRKRILDVLRRDFDSSRVIVLKDPRISLLLPIWLEILEQFQAHPEFVICLRDPLAVAASLERRDHFSRQQSLLLWTRYTLDAERYTRNRPRCFVQYEQFLEQPRQEAERIGRALGLRGADQPMLDSIEKTASREYCHHQATIETLPSSEPVVSWARELSGLLQKAASATALDSAGLDRLREICNTSTHPFAWLLREQNQSYRREAQLRREISDVGAAERRASAVADARGMELNAHKQEIAHLMHDLVEHRSYIGKLQSDAEATKTAAEAALREAETLRAELASRAAAPAVYSEPALGKPPPTSNGVPHRSAAPSESKWSKRSLGAIVRQITKESTAVPKLPEREAVALLLRQSGLFDETYYRKQFPAPIAGDPVLHYIDQGNREGYDPCLLFHTDYYRQMNPDAQNVNALWHFLRVGAPRGRNPHPFFDVRFYLHSNPDVAATPVNPLRHFMEHGINEDRPPNRLFDCAYYKRTYPDVAAAGISPVLHYLEHGHAEGRNPSAFFETTFYRRMNPEIDELKLDPLSYYLWHGILNGQALLSPAACGPCAG